MKLTVFYLFFNIVIIVSAQMVMIPATATKTEQKAGQELVEHLSKAVNRKIILKKEGEVTDGPVIYVGKTKFASRQGIKFDDFGKEEWLIKSFGNDLVVGGGQPRGVVYGALELLERQFGVLWLDERFTWIPPITEIKWPTNLNLRGKPAFKVRGIHAYHRNPQKARRIFMTRNRQNLFHGESNIEYLKQWGIFKIIGSPRECHTYYNYSKGWGPENEDCFSLSKNGKRLRAVSASGPGQVCFSNPKTRKLFSAKLRDFIKADRAKCSDGNYPLIYDISSNDNRTRCVCSNCLAKAKKYNSYGGLVLEFTNAIADSIASDYPDVKVQMFAYTFTEKFPKKIKARSNVLVRLAQLGTEFEGIRDSLRPLSHPNNKLSKQQVLGWSKVASLAIWDYWIIFNKDLEASSCTKAITENLRFYRDHNVISMFAESEKPLATCFYALRIWLGFRFMNNPDLDATKQIDCFMKIYYGPAAPFMKEFLKYLESRNSEIKGCLGNFFVQRRADLDDAFFVKANELFDVAETAVADNQDYLRRIAKERVIIDRIRLLRRSELKTFDPKLEIKRLEKNYPSACKDYLSKGNSIKKAMEKLQRFLESLTVSISLPEKFKNANVAFDMPWFRLQSCTRQAKMTKVADAAGGKAIVLEDFKDTGDLHFGFYNISNKKQTHTIKIKRKLLPQDEKFHFYKIGKVNLPPKSYVWAHPTWFIQNKLNEFYKPNGNNNYEIFVSLKVQGPAYVNSSNKKNAVMMDRILLIRPKKETPSVIALPLELSKRKVAHDLTYQQLKAIPAYGVAKVSDIDAAGKVALKLGKGVKHGILQYGSYDRVGEKMISVRKVQKGRLAKDENFHLYSLGKIKLSPSCYVWIHPSSYVQRSLSKFYQPNGDNNYEVFVSVKVQGPAYVPGSNKDNAILLDRILLVR